MSESGFPNCGIFTNEESRTIYFAGGFTPENGRAFIWNLKELETQDPLKDIDVIISSNGGSLDVFLAIYDVIRTLKCKVNTFALGNAYSAGAYLLLAGTGKRAAYKHANIMIHQLSSGNEGAFRDMEIRQNFLRQQQRRLEELTALHTKQPIAKIKEDLARDKWMTAEEAMGYGIVDEVI